MLGTGARARLPILFLAPPVLLGCGSDSRAARIGDARRDSAGVEIVESHSPAWVEGRSWKLDPEPEVEMGSEGADSTPALVEVKSVLLLDDGRIVVANGGTSELLWFDSLSTFRRATGGPGEGPGEFTSIVSLHRCSGDTLLVTEWSRLSRFDASGRFVDSKRVVPRIEDHGGFSLHGPTWDCSALLVASRQTSPPPRKKAYALPATLFWWDLETGARDTLASFSIYDVFGMVRNGRVLPFIIPWTRRTYWAMARNLLFLGETNQPEFRVFDRQGGLRRILRHAAEPRPVTDADRTWFAVRREELTARFPSLTGPSRLPKLADFPVPDERPAYSGLLADDEGNLWVRHYPRSLGGWSYLVSWDRTADPEAWTLFDRKGRWLGSLAMPAGFQVLTVQDGRVVGIWRDAYDVEHVRIHRLNKGRAEGEAVQYEGLTPG